MRKRLTHAIAFFFILLTFASILSLYIPKSWAATENGDIQIIPNNAIRLRILANSNSETDQEIKRMVRDRVNEQITEWVSDLTNLEDARTIIVENLDELQEIAYEVLEEEGINQTIDIEFSEVAFPTKLYGNLLYPAGTYEAVLITIGEGKGANWWCVLFPPLCFLDFSRGTAVSEGVEEEASVDSEIAKAEKRSENDEIEAIDVNGQPDNETDAQPEIKEIVVHEEKEVEKKFFIVELFQKIVAFIGSMFDGILG